MGAFWDKATILKMSRLRVVYAVVFLSAFVLTELGRFVYRPYVYRSGLDDFGIADTMGNSLGVVTQIFCLLAVMHSNWRQGIRVIAFATCGYIAYEFMQLVLPRGTFDMKDVIATLAGGVVSLGILSLARLCAGDRIVAGSSEERADSGAV